MGLYQSCFSTITFCAARLTDLECILLTSQHRCRLLLTEEMKMLHSTRYLVVILTIRAAPLTTAIPIVFFLPSTRRNSHVDNNVIRDGQMRWPWLRTSTNREVGSSETLTRHFVPPLVLPLSRSLTLSVISILTVDIASYVSQI